MKEKIMGLIKDIAKMLDQNLINSYPIATFTFQQFRNEACKMKPIVMVEEKGKPKLFQENIRWTFWVCQSIVCLF